LSVTRANCSLQALMTQSLNVILMLESHLMSSLTTTVTAALWLHN